MGLHKLGFQTFCHRLLPLQYIFQHELLIRNKFLGFHIQCRSQFKKIPPPGYGEVPDDLCSTQREKTMKAMKAPRAVTRITFNPSEANLGETLNVHVPKLNENEVLVPSSLALRFDIDVSGGHAKNFLVQIVSRALVS